MAVRRRLLVVALAVAAAGCGRYAFGDQRFDGGADDPDALANVCDRGRTDLIACDDFDDPQLPDWTVFANSGSSIGPVAMAGGGFAVVASARAAGGAALIKHALSSPLTDGMVYLRVRGRAPAGFVLRGFVVVAELTSANGKLSVDFENQDRIQLFTPGALSTGPPGSLARDQWLCFEVEVKIAPAAADGFARLLIDGIMPREVPVGTATAVNGGYTSVNLGASSSMANDALEVHLDDFVLARAPVGCD